MEAVYTAAEHPDAGVWILVGTGSTFNANAAITGAAGTSASRSGVPSMPNAPLTSTGGLNVSDASSTCNADVSFCGTFPGVSVSNLDQPQLRNLHRCTSQRLQSWNDQPLAGTYDVGDLPAFREGTVSFLPADNPDRQPQLQNRRQLNAPKEPNPQRQSFRGQRHAEPQWTTDDRRLVHAGRQCDHQSRGCRRQDLGQSLRIFRRRPYVLNGTDVLPVLLASAAGRRSPTPCR